jgi:hypothetical protein
MRYINLALLTLLLTACGVGNWFVQSLGLYKLGIGEKEVKYIQEPRRQPEKQPNTQQLIQERGLAKTKSHQDRLHNTVLPTDPYSNRSQNMGMPPVAAPGTAYPSPLDGANQ